MKSYKRTIPEKSLIQTALPRIDYADVFAIETDRAVNMADLPILFFNSFPAWFMVLMGIREKLAKIIGLKTAAGMDVAKQMEDFKGEVGESIALFHVLGRTDEEILSGENDSHLNFRLSFFCLPKEGKKEISLATTVLFNNWIGRLYFLPVGPIHRLIVPILLKRMVEQLPDSDK